MKDELNNLNDDDLERLLDELDDEDENWVDTRTTEQRARDQELENQRRKECLERQREEEARLVSLEACKARVQEKKEHYGRNRMGGFFLLDGWLFHDMVQQRPLCDPWLLRAVLGSLRRDSRPFYKNSENQWVPRSDIRNNGRQLDGRQYSFLTTKQLSSWLRQRCWNDFVPFAISNLSDASSPLHAIVSHSDEGFFHLKPVYAGIIVSHYLWDTEILSPEEKDVILQIAWWFKSRRGTLFPHTWRSERGRDYVVVDFEDDHRFFKLLYQNEETLRNALDFLNHFVSIEQNIMDKSFVVECKNYPNNQIYRMFLHATKS